MLVKNENVKIRIAKLLTPPVLGTESYFIVIFFPIVKKNFIFGLIKIHTNLLVMMNGANIVDFINLFCLVNLLQKFIGLLRIQGLKDVIFRLRGIFFAERCIRYSKVQARRSIIRF